MDVRGLVQSMLESGAFNRIVNNPLAQFGSVNRHYLGADLLPEQMKIENQYTETGIKYRTIMANDGTRYSPVQIKGGVLQGSFDVKLYDSDIGSMFDGAQYDGLIRLIEQATGTQGMPGGGVDRPTMEAMGQMTAWADVTLTRPLQEKLELQRWQAICNAQVVRRGDGGYTETVNYSNPTGHRVTAGGAWSNNSYDPYPDIIAGIEFLAAKGFRASRLIGSTTIRTKLSLNQQIRTRVGRLSMIGGTVTGLAGRATLAQINAQFSEDDIPPLELYDLTYRTNTGFQYFFPRDTVVLVCETGRDQMIDRGDLEPVIVGNTLGYTGVGRPAGQSAPGRVVKVRAIDDSKPPRIEGEAWQTALPVIEEPEALYVISGIS